MGTRCLNRGTGPTQQSRFFSVNVLFPGLFNALTGGQVTQLAKNAKFRGRKGPWAEEFTNHRSPL